MNFRSFWAAVMMVLIVLSHTSEMPEAAEDKGYVLIHQTYSGGDFWTRGLLVQAWTIDGKLKSTLFGKPVKAPAGKHVIGLRAEFELKPKNFLIEPKRKYADIFEFSVTLMPGRSYVAAGSQSGTYVELWIEDMQTQEVISEVVEINVQKCKLFSCPPAQVKTRSSLY